MSHDDATPNAESMDGPPNESAGDTPTDATEAAPDERAADGRVDALSRRDFVRASAGVGAAAALGLSVTGTATAISTPRLHRDGNLLRDPEGNRVVLRGVNVADPKRLNDQNRRYHVDAELVIDRATAEDDGWYNRVIRIPCQTGDIAGAGSNEVAPGTMTRSDVESYVADHLRPAVDRCAERGVYAIVDYHRHARDQLLYTDDALDEEVRMFWDVVAPEFADDEHVLFEVYNEPIAPYGGHNDPTGGLDVTDPEAEQYWQTWKETAQPWVDLIRDRAPESLILIGSPRWSQYTYWAAEDEFEGENLAYTGHVYAQEGLRPLSEYFGTPAEEVPVFVSEWGYDDEGQDYIRGTTAEEGQEFLDFFEEYDSVHWQAWAFDPRWEPVMFEEDQGEWTLLTGEGYHGDLVKEYLAEKREDDLPAGSGDADGTGDGTGGSSDSGGDADGGDTDGGETDGGNGDGGAGDGEPPADALVVNDYDGDPAWPGRNDLQNWNGAGSFENGGGSGEVVDGALVLEYDGAGWFQEGISRDVGDYDDVVFSIRGASGGEGEEFVFDLGGASATFSEVAGDSIGTSFADVAVDLTAAGVDAAAPGNLRLDFYQGGSSTVEIDEIRFE